MVYEKLDLGFDIEKLKKHLAEVVFKFPPVATGDRGGWSITSVSGKYNDGWEYRKDFFREINGVCVVDTEKVEAARIPKISEHKNPTEICSGYLSQVLARIEELGLSPRRARVVFMKSGGKMMLHRDGTPESYMVRLHIPIITNPGCVFWCEEGEVHMPADGSGYLIRVNRPHQAFNRGATDRYHIIMDVWDTRGVSKFHRC